VIGFDKVYDKVCHKNRKTFPILRLASLFCLLAGVSLAQTVTNRTAVGAN